MRVFRLSYLSAQLDPTEVDLFECHGTSTEVGEKVKVVLEQFRLCAAILHHPGPGRSFDDHPRSSQDGKSSSTALFPAPEAVVVTGRSVQPDAGCTIPKMLYH